MESEVKNFDKIIAEIRKYSYDKPLKVECNGVLNSHFHINVSWTAPDYRPGYPMNILGSHLCIFLRDERFTYSYKYLDKEPKTVGDVITELHKISGPLYDISVFHFSKQSGYYYDCEHLGKPVDITDWFSITSDDNAVVMHIKTNSFPIDDDGFHLTNEFPVKKVYTQTVDMKGNNYIVYGPVLNEKEEKVLYVSSLAHGAGWMKFMNVLKLKAYFMLQKYKERKKVGENSYIFGNFDTIDVEKWKYIE